MEPKIEKILRKNQNDFRSNRSTTSQIFTIRRILGVRAKNLEATILFVDLSKAFDSIHRGRMVQILLTYGLLKETVAAIMMLYKHTKVKVRSPDGNTDYFDTVADVLQGATLSPYLFIICQYYLLRTSIDIMKDDGFKLSKERSRRYPVQTISFNLALDVLFFLFISFTVCQAIRDCQSSAKFLILLIKPWIYFIPFSLC